MEIIVYADFSCPYCYLASLRADQLLWSGAAEIDWRAVTHAAPMTGAMTGTWPRSRRSPGRVRRGRIHWAAR